MAANALANAMKIRNLSIEKEINAMLNPLNQKKSNISLSLKALSVLSDNIKQNTLKYQQDIESHFNEIIQQIQRRKQQLFNKISLIEKNKLYQIDQQRQSLTNHQSSIINALSSCKAIINDKTNNLKPAEKKQKIRSLSNNTLELPSRITVKDKIKYTFNQQNISPVL